jgi:hypothetical protein
MTSNLNEEVSGLGSGRLKERLLVAIAREGSSMERKLVKEIRRQERVIVELRKKANRLEDRIIKLRSPKEEGGFG